MSNPPIKRLKAASSSDTEMSGTSDNDENQQQAGGSIDVEIHQEEEEVTGSMNDAKGEDVVMSEIDDLQDQEAYESLVKELLLKRYLQEDDDTLVVSLAISNETVVPENEEITFLRNEFMTAIVCAFKEKHKMVLQKQTISLAAGAIADASSDFLEEQQHLLKIKNAKRLDQFLGGLCKEVLQDYYAKMEALAQSKTASFESLQNRMVPVDYCIDGTKLSHDFDVQEFVRQAEEVSDWFSRAEATQNEQDSSTRSSADYEDAPYFCVVQSSGMGKTKIIYEGCKRLKNKGWSCFMVLHSTLNEAKELLEREVFSYLIDLQVSETTRTALDAAKETLGKLDSFYEGLIGNQEEHSKDKPIFLCFDEAQLYLKPAKFEDGKEHSAFLFRCIRLWLRQKGREHKVIACFCGTTATLASFRLEADPKLPDSSSREFTPQQSDLYDKGKKVFPIFLQTTTMGCLSSVGSLEGSTEYEEAVRRGRPLFEIMRKNDVLARNESTIVRRMLLYGLKNDWKIGNESLDSCLSILGTRVQMGQTSFSIASDMVGHGYANLTYATSTDAMICYMPDPVCGCLAMKLMDSKWKESDERGKDSKEITGKDSKKITGRNAVWWLLKMKEIFSQGLCRPEKGDFGEIMVALYFLFCSDVLRRKQNQGYQHFSVPLGDWIQVLASGGVEEGRTAQNPTPEESASTTGSEVVHTRKSKRLLAKSQNTNIAADESMDDVCEVKATISFIQVCRSYLRSYGVDWEGLCSQNFLSHIYTSGTAFYVYPGCPIIDLVAPIKLSGKEGDYFVPMVVSIKAHAYYSPAHARGVCRQMREQFEYIENRKYGALCLLVVLGSTSVSDDNDLTLEKTAVRELSQKNQVVSRVLRIPTEDAFGGFCQTFHTLTSEISRGTSEVFASHSFVRGHCKDVTTEELHERYALRAAAGREESEFLRTIREQFKE